MGERRPRVALAKRRVREARMRAKSYRCVLCLEPYGEAEDRAALYVFPDGCTAHRACEAREGWPGRRGWHSLVGRAEDELRRREAVDV